MRAHYKASSSHRWDRGQEGSTSLTASGTERSEEDRYKIHSDPVPFYFIHSLGWWSPAIYHTQGCRIEPRSGLGNRETRHRQQGLWASVALRFMSNEVPPLVKALQRLPLTFQHCIWGPRALAPPPVNSHWLTILQQQLLLGISSIPPCSNPVLFDMQECLPTIQHPKPAHPSFGSVGNSNSSFKISAQHQLPDL